MTPATLSWVAGLFEGEGTVTISGGGKRPYTRLVVVVTNTDAELLQVFMEHWPAAKLRHIQKDTGQKDAFEWRLSCLKAAAFLRDIQPYVRSGRMKARINLALVAQAERRQGSRNNCRAYQALHEGFRSQMRLLNKRGA